MDEHEFGNGGGLTRTIKAFKCSMQGLQSAWRNESAFQQELFLAVPFLTLSLWISESAFQFALLLFTVALVLIVELLNSTIESVVDHVGIEHHELSGRPKDIASAAVFLSLLMPPTCLVLIACENSF